MDRGFSRRDWRAFAVCDVAGGRPGRGQALDKVTFGTNWVAEAEHGGFYQALADGTYRKYGLDVTIRQGGPSANNRILLPVGKIDFFLSAPITCKGSTRSTQNIPTVEVAAFFQKDPQVLIAHPDQGHRQTAGFEEADAVRIAGRRGDLLPVA